MEPVYIEYGTKEIEYLKQKDKTLSAAIDKIGHIYRVADTDIFRSVINQIIGQQISMSAQKTICNRLNELIPNLSPETICDCPADKLQSIGISYRKAEYIKDFALKVFTGEFDINSLNTMSDDEVISALSTLTGIGEWTAEMLLIFSMRRPNILSFGDLGIKRGLRMLYHHRQIDKRRFLKYKRRYSPYSTIASLYLWAIAGGAIPEMKDYAPKPKISGKK